MADSQAVSGTVPPGVGREVLLETIDGTIAVITLNRPEARNAINGRLAAALGHLVQRVEHDGDIRAIIINSSHERVFCAGADLGEIAAGRLSDLFTADGGFAGFQDAVRNKPWIAAVHGAALAAGLEMILGCDMIVASDQATFGLPEVKRGLYPGIGVMRLPAAFPRNLSLEMLATGEPISAEKAKAFGLVNHVVGLEQVLPRAIALARSIAANAPLAVQGVLKLGRRVAGDPDDSTRRAAAEIGSPIMNSADAREGARAFMEKRTPQWTGR